MCENYANKSRIIHFPSQGEDAVGSFSLENAKMALRSLQRIQDDVKWRVVSVENHEKRCHLPQKFQESKTQCNWNFSGQGERR